MLAPDESPSSLQLWSLELKVKLYIIGKSWEMNQMFENENDCVVLLSVYSLIIHSITVWRQPKHSFTVLLATSTSVLVNLHS